MELWRNDYPIYPIGKWLTLLRQTREAVWDRDLFQSHEVFAY